MSTSQSATAAAAILVLAGIGIGAGWYVGTLPFVQGLHGPVGAVIALPFVLLAFVGAVVLAIVAHRKRDRSPRRARIIALAPLWLIAVLFVLSIAANLLPRSG